MTLAARRRTAARVALLDRSLEELPLFRLSDSADDSAIHFSSENGARWRVLPAPGDRLPGTFDQDVYVELMHRFGEAGSPRDGIVTFTLHAFLRSMGRRVDGRTYEQLRNALTRLERTVIERATVTENGEAIDARFSVLSSVAIERRRLVDRDQLPLFPVVSAAEPGVARVTIAPSIRQSIEARESITLNIQQYLAMPSPVARRLYRLLEVARSEGRVTWRVPLDRLRDQLPLVQRFPSHLQRVLQPAHVMLRGAGLVRSATIKQQNREWFADYVLAGRK